MDTVPTRPRRLPLFLIGIALFFLGPAIYAIRLNLQYLDPPFYVALLTTTGVLLMALSTWLRGGILRKVGLVAFVLLCGFSWFIAVVQNRTPTYTGPAKEGRKVPEFAARRADGASFTDRDLDQGNRTVLLFFRGRW